MASIPTIVGTKFLANPAARKLGLSSRPTLAPKSRLASSHISSSDCGSGRGRGDSLRMSSGMSENNSSMEPIPIAESISCSLPRFGNWSNATFSCLSAHRGE